MLRVVEHDVGPSMWPVECFFPNLLETWTAAPRVAPAARKIQILLVPNTKWLYFSGSAHPPSLAGGRWGPGQLISPDPGNQKWGREHCRLVYGCSVVRWEGCECARWAIGAIARISRGDIVQDTLSTT